MSDPGKYTWCCLEGEPSEFHYGTVACIRVGAHRVFASVCEVDGNFAWVQFPDVVEQILLPIAPPAPTAAASPAPDLIQPEIDRVREMNAELLTRLNAATAERDEARDKLHAMDRAFNEARDMQTKVERQRDEALAKVAAVARIASDRWSELHRIYDRLKGLLEAPDRAVRQPPADKVTEAARRECDAEVRKLFSSQSQGGAAR